MVNNLIQEAQRDDWCGQIVARPQLSYMMNEKYQEYQKQQNEIYNKLWELLKID